MLQDSWYNNGKTLIWHWGMKYAKQVSKTVKKSNKRTVDYEVGAILICRKYALKKLIKCQLRIWNHRGSSTKLIKDYTLNQSHTVLLEQIGIYFIHGYCRTCHSLQW